MLLGATNTLTQIPAHTHSLVAWLVVCHVPTRQRHLSYHLIADAARLPAQLLARMQLLRAQPRAAPAAAHGLVLCIICVAAAGAGVATGQAPVTALLAAAIASDDCKVAWLVDEGGVAVVLACQL